VIVSDDAGMDDTERVVEAFRTTLPSNLRVLLRYERSSTRLGIGGNFDRAVRLANGGYVVKLDSDDILEPKFIEILSGQLQANPHAGWAHCNVWNVRPDLSNINLAHTRKASGFYEANTTLPGYLKHNDTCHCVLIRKSAYLSVGGYRHEMKTAEDWLLWVEMLMGGWGYCFDSRPLAKMRKYESRPELMTRRRKDFIMSMHFMKTRLECLANDKMQDGKTLSPKTMMELFGKTAAKLCVSSGCDEGNPEIRRMLFKAAYELNPSFGNQLWKTLGMPLPTGVTRALSQFSGLPRRYARAAFQRIRAAHAAVRADH
jgi:glycosyltransferase involved in cell wall biosynthesis